LVEAARRFDPDRGVRLGTYAAWWIRAYMRRHTLDNRRIVRAPSSRKGRTVLANLRKTQRDLTRQNGAPPSADLVAETLGVSVRDVEEVEAVLSNRDLSVGLHDKAIDIAAEGPSPEGMVADTEDHARSVGLLRQAFELLTNRERQILKGRYLMGELASLASLGRELGLSRERIRQLELQAQTKIRNALSFRGAFAESQA
jgi:RNA polymerase sigma-32 factor